MSDDFEEIALPDPQVLRLEDEQTLDQADIDALFGDIATPTPRKSGLRAVIESKVVNHERMPMLEVVYDRVIRTFATDMRNLTSDAIDVSLQETSSVRFGEFMNRVPLPAMFGVFRVEQWDNFGIVTVDSGLIYAVVDALLGGRKGNASPRIEGRAFTSIETSLVARMIELVLSNLAAAFEPITPVTAKIERVETSPRFAAIAGPSNITSMATFRVDMEGRGGCFSILLPYATLESVRDKLLQRFMGEKLGHDSIWETHMEAQLRKTEVKVDAVIAERMMRIDEIRAFAVGQTLALNRGPDDALEIQCGGVRLARAQMGSRNRNIAVRLTTGLSNGNQK